MKRILSLLLVLVCFAALLAGCGVTKTDGTTSVDTTAVGTAVETVAETTVAATTVAAADPAAVYVTIADKSGAAVLKYAEINVTDLDADGKLTIFEALKAAHATCPNGGANGFVAEEGQYGLSMVKLWGEENGGSFGYYVNEASAWSLLDEVHEGDRLVAFSYTDTTGFTDRLAYFAPITAKVNASETVTLTLTALIPDASWNNVPTPVAGAKIFVNGADSGLTTDADGKVTLTLTAGVNEITATSETVILVPPFAFVTVE